MQFFVQTFRSYNGHPSPTRFGSDWQQCARDDHGGNRTLLDVTFHSSGRIQQSNILSCGKLRYGHDGAKIVVIGYISGSAERRLCWHQFLLVVQALFWTELVTGSTEYNNQTLYLVLFFDSDTMVRLMLRLAAHMGPAELRCVDSNFYIFVQALFLT